VTERETQISGISAEMNSDFRAFQAILKDLQHRAGATLEDDVQFALCFTISDRPEQMSLLRSEPDKAAEFLVRAIRNEAIFVTAGTQWHPYRLPLEFEVAPLLAWDGRNARWISSS
jgi:hypothetical protein